MLPGNDYVTGKLWNLRGYMYENLGYPFCGFRVIKPKLHVLILWFQTPQLVGALKPVSAMRVSVKDKSGKETEASNALTRCTRTQQVGLGRAHLPART